LGTVLHLFLVSEQVVLMETEGQRLIFKNKLKEAIEVLETFA